MTFLIAKLTNKKIMEIPTINEKESKEETQIRSLIDLKTSELTAKSVFDLAKEGDDLALIVYRNFSR